MVIQRYFTEIYNNTTLSSLNVVSMIENKSVYLFEVLFSFM